MRPLESVKPSDHDENRVVNRKRHEPDRKKGPFGFVSGVELGLWQTQALTKTKKNNSSMKYKCSYCSFGLYECLSLLNVELNTENEPKRLLVRGCRDRLVSFSVFNLVTRVG